MKERGDFETDDLPSGGGGGGGDGGGDGDGGNEEGKD